MAKLTRIGFGNFKLDLQTFWKKESGIIIKTLKRLITLQRGVKMDNAPNNTPSTIKQKGKSHWLVNTGQLRAKGILSKWTKSVLTIFVNPAKHPNARNNFGYDDIFEEHTQEYSGLFSQLPAGTKTPERIANEVNDQLYRHIKKKLKRRVKL